MALCCAGIGDSMTAIPDAGMDETSVERWTKNVAWIYLPIIPRRLIEMTQETVPTREQEPVAHSTITGDPVDRETGIHGSFWNISANYEYPGAILMFEFMNCMCYPILKSTLCELLQIVFLALFALINAPHVNRHKRSPDAISGFPRTGRDQ
jgi:hypothetical protein